jgi:hypothetical protein
MNQSDRPAQIATILKTIHSEYPDDVGAALEAYIAELETRPLAILPKHGNVRSLTPHDPPKWSQARVIERENKRRVRAFKKQNNYQ